MMTTLLDSSVTSPTCHVGVGTALLGKATDVEPLVHSHSKKLPGCPCSTAATMISANPMVEMRAAIGGAWRRRRGRRHTYSMTSPMNAEAAIPPMQATQNACPY